MDDQEELRHKLAEQIKEAFADTPYPGDENIGWGCGVEGEEFELALRGKQWNELSLDFLIKHRHKTPCMTPDGFRYYLPAFLLGVLLYWEAVDTLSESLISRLTPPDVNYNYRVMLLQTIFQYRPRLELLGLPLGLDEVQPVDDREIQYYQKQVSVFAPLEIEAIFTFLANYTELFPQDAFQQERTQQAAAFWRDQIK